MSKPKEKVYVIQAPRGPRTHHLVVSRNVPQAGLAYPAACGVMVHARGGEPIYDPERDDPCVRCRRSPTKREPGPPVGPAVVCGACGGGPDDCDCKPDALLLEGAVELVVVVHLGVTRQPGGAFEIGRAWFEGRELDDDERARIDLGKIVEAADAMMSVFKDENEPTAYDLGMEDF